MKPVTLKKGNIFGKGLFANKPFKKGEVVLKYHLKPISEQEFTKLSKTERYFVHTHWGVLYLYPPPERYVNHSDQPNTIQDLRSQCALALRDIKKGEQITTDASKDDT